MPTPRPAPSPRKAAHSVTEVARLCGMSRARFYDLIRGGVMPHPVYSTRTRRPLYTADLAALAVRVKETNVGIDGGYVIFYARRTEQASTAPVKGASTSRHVPPEPPEPLVKEMVEALRAMGVRACEEELTAAVARQCPLGPREETFEFDLRAIFDHLRCRDVG